MSKQTSSPFFRFFIKTEAFIMNNFVPVEKPGPIFKWIFKSSILYFKLGLGGLLKNYFLLLKTTGRKTGKVRQTPLEHRYDEVNDRYLIMSGWAGRTDWHRNVRANPNVHVQVGNRKFHCRAEPASEVDVVLILEATARISPGMLKVWSRWVGEELNGSRESLQRAAKYCPSFWLRPE
jgi:deazaflavin-dependent oxidoreductase (nitroreductase family)